ncbi:DUF2642 domain-containing protein [Priestia megaterium]|uniref:DUF2642 domain-containing protein n=1 Tax=Priestia megaterium TaxID=1404 RepID=A0A6H1P5M1_PRIMG|nr:DUF2642 domain-containing protein [Priestia megaterium]QIZ08843.1 DUF2642 domain-containing protein [Priestia megaterium]
MNIELLDLRDKYIEVEISGGSFHRGILIDAGLDIVVIYDGRNNTFLYIPFVHIQKLKEILIQEETFYDPPSEKPITSDSISYRKILTSAKGLFVEVYVTGNKSIHGYLTSIMNDYFVFHSPAYKTMYISMNHVKWLIPYPPNTTPYSFENQNLPLKPVYPTLARSFEQQLKKLENQLIIIDGGYNEEKIGLLQKVQNNKMILITAKGEKLFRNLEHIKTIQLP